MKGAEIPTITTDRPEAVSSGHRFEIEPGYDGFLAFAERVGLRLEPFQRRIARAAHESRELLVLLARGNGKSRLIGTLAVHHLLTTESPAVYVAAASRDQARVVFEYAREVAEALDLEELIVRHLELRVPGGHLRVLASDAPKLHGIHPTLAVIDEMQAFKDGSVYEALRTGLLEGSQLWTISTAGQGATSPLGVLRRRALAGRHVLRRGALTDARNGTLRMLEWSVADEREVTDGRAAKSANPASWISRSGLAEQRRALPELAYRRFHLNQWVARMGSWLPAGAWQRCGGASAMAEGSKVWVGVDIGGARADTAVVWLDEDYRERGDLRAGSWQMVVSRDRWAGDTRHVEAIQELRDVSVVSAPAYPAAAVEYRAAPTTTQEDEMSDSSTSPVPAEEARAEDSEKTEDRERDDRRHGSLKVEHRTQRPGGRGLAEEFRSRGFPGERATLGWDEYRAITLPSPVDDLSPSRQEGVPLGADQRYAYPSVPQVAVGADVTSVQVLRQTSRTLPAATAVVRAIDATSEKPEVGTVLEVDTVPLRQVAATEQGVPNIALAQNTASSIIETDLRLAVNEGLDELVLSELYAAPSVPYDSGDPLLVAIRQAITVAQAEGYAPDTLLLPPADAEALDTLVTGVSGGDADFVFAPGQFAPGSLFGMNVRIVKGAADPIVLDASAIGKLYVSPISLSRFEENAGQTNTSTVRLEGHAAFGVERIDAVVVVGTAS